MKKPKDHNYDLYMAQLETCITNKDIEAAHNDADHVLCNLLKDLGYQDIVILWEAVEKWYA